MRMLEMKIKGLSCCPATKRKTIILEYLPGEKFMPLLLDTGEAEVFSLELQGKPFSQPTIHHLLITMLGAVRGKIKYLIIYELRDNVVCASISLDIGGSETIRRLQRLRCPDAGLQDQGPTLCVPMGFGSSGQRYRENNNRKVRF